MLFLQVSALKRPICPTFIQDDGTRLVIFVVGIVVCLYVLYRAMRYFGGT